MKKFLKNITLSVFLIFTFITTIIVFTNHKIEKDNCTHLSKNIKLLILGHSHAQYAFNDSLIDNSKNLAQAGELFFYTYLKLKKISNDNKQIQTIFLEFSNNQIVSEMDKWTESEEDILYRVPKYSPFMNYESYKYIFAKNPSALAKSFPLMFKNNINTLLTGNENYLEHQDWGGYFNHNKNNVDSLLQVRKKLKIDKKEKLMFSNVNLEYLYKIILFCKQRKIKLFLVRSPQHKEYPILSNERIFLKVIKNNLAQISFLDFNKFPLLNQDYVDLQHLNYKGAKKFSLFFNNLLRRGLLKIIDKQQFINNEIEKLSKNNID